MLIEESASAATDLRLKNDDHVLLGYLIKTMHGDYAVPGGGMNMATRPVLAAETGLSLQRIRDSIKRLTECGYLQNQGRSVIVVDSSAVWREEDYVAISLAPLADEVPYCLRDDERYDSRYWRLTHWPDPKRPGRWCIAEQYKGVWRIITDDLDQNVAGYLTSSTHAMAKCQGYTPAWYDPDTETAFAQS